MRVESRVGELGGDGWVSVSQLSALNSQLRVASATRLALVNEDRVAVGVVDDGHEAAGRFERLHLKGHVMRAEMGDGGLEIGDLERDRAAIRAGLELRRAADADRAGADIILTPLHTAGRAVDHRALQAEHALVKRPRALEV